METIFSLAVTLLCLSLISMSYTHFQQVQAQSKQGKQTEFHLFLYQLEQDIKHKEFISMKHNELNFKQKDEEGFFQTVTYAKDIWVFKRTVSGMGYQPMLTDAHTIRFTMEGNFIHMYVLFRNEEVYEAKLDISENKALVLE